MTETTAEPDGYGERCPECNMPLAMHHDPACGRPCGRCEVTSALTAARDEFLAASVAVWREIDRLDSRPEGYHPTRMDVELRKRERSAWERYRDVLEEGYATRQAEEFTAADLDERG